MATLEVTFEFDGSVAPTVNCHMVIMGGEGSRAVVRRRCGRAALCGGVTSSLVAFAGAAPLTALLTGALNLILALFRSAILMRPPTISTHRTGRFFKLFTPQKLAGAILHILCGLFASLSCLKLLGLTITDQCVKSTETCLQERSVIILFAGISNGFYYYVRTYIFDDPAVTFPLIEQRKFIRIKLSIGPIFRKAIRDSFVPVLFSSFLYYWKGGLFRNTFTYVYGVTLKDEPIDGLFSALSPSIFFRLWLNSFLFLCTVYSVVLLFDISLTERLKFPIESSIDFPSLADELAGDVEILSKLAARDLSHLVYDDRERRSQIFTLSQPGGHPTNWKNLLRECLKVIDSFIKNLDNITNDMKTVEDTKVSQSHRQMMSPEPFKQTRLRNLTLSSPQSPLNQYMTPEEPVKPFNDTIKEEFRNFINNLCKRPGINFFFGELTDIKIKHLAHRGQVIAKISQGIAHLAMVSLDEDVYGVVQDDLALIITSLLRLKLSLDKFTKSGIINKKNLKQEFAPIQMLTELKSAVKRSIYKITISFRDYLYDLALDNETHMMLQPFLNMREG